MNIINCKNAIKALALKYKAALFAFSCFLLAFLLHYCFLAPYDDLISGSADASSIWASITTFHSGAMESSYMLYNGIQSVYPYVWLYSLANLLGVNDFLFIKIFLSLLFACAAACMPYIFSVLLKRKIHVIRQAAWILIAFLIWKPYGVFESIAVDLPSFAYLTIAAVVAVKLGQAELFTGKIFLYCLLAGLVFGFSSLGSFPYMLTALFLSLYVAIQLFQKALDGKAPTKFRVIAPVICAILLVAGIAVPHLSNRHFEKTVVQPFRDRGEWLPTKGDWLMYGLSRDLLQMASGPATLTLPDKRGEAIIMGVAGEEGEERIRDILAGGGAYSMDQYRSMIFQHPIDFLSRWHNRFFWILNMDNGTSSIIRMLTGFTLLYVALYCVYKNMKTIRSIIKPGLLIAATFIVPSLLPCLMHAEKRYSLPIQALILCAGLFWPMPDYNLLKRIRFPAAAEKEAAHSQIHMSKNTKGVKGRKPVLGQGEPKPGESVMMADESASPLVILVIYAIFIVMCFLHHAIIMETYGASIEILFSI